MSQPFPEPLAVDHSEEWCTIRATGIGASEAAAACNQDRYTNAYALASIKLGRIPADDESLAMRRGRAMEPYIAGEFERETGVKVLRSPVGIYRHPEFSHILASPDAWVQKDDQRPVTAEWKSTRSYLTRSLLSTHSHALPIECREWILQCQQQMAVLGTPMAYVAVDIDDAVKVFTVERSDRVIEQLIRIETELWELIKKGDLPEPDFTHAKTLEVEKALYTTDSGTRVKATVEEFSLVKRDRELKERKKVIDAERGEIQARLRHTIGDHSALLLPDDREIRRVKQGRGWALRECNAVVGGEVIDSPDTDFWGEWKRATFSLENADFRCYERSPTEQKWISPRGSRRIVISQGEPSVIASKYNVNVKYFRVDADGDLDRLDVELMRAN